MNWFAARIYDRFMKGMEDAGLQQWRRELLKQAQGQVLELGAGTGANVENYPDGLERVLLTEPDSIMRKKLEKRVAKVRRSEFEVGAQKVEELSGQREKFDTAVVTLVLCSVPDLSGALDAIYEALRPGGRLLFIEHVASDHSVRYGVQRVVEPVWKCCAGNCHITRDTEAAIQAAGFEMESIQREGLKKALPPMRPSIRGVARRS